MPVRTFDYSQNTFGGSLACTPIATLTACGFADDQIAEEKFKTYCEVGSKMWKQIAERPLSVQEVTDFYAFFAENYDIESYQCCVEDDATEDGKYLSIKQFLNDVVRNELMSKGSFGIVFTDGASSFATGHSDDKWWIFDSHVRASLYTGPFKEYVERLRSQLQLMRIVDSTTFVSKPLA